MLIKPDPTRRTWWRARYVDPDTGRTVKVTLDATLTTTELRDTWAVRKSKALAKRRLELEHGALPTTGTALADALDRYFADHPKLRAGTRAVYKAPAEKLKAWAARHGVHSADDLTGPKLLAFRADLVREKRRVHVKGGRRGELMTTEQARSPATVNQELRAIRTILGYLRKCGLLPRLTTDGLRDGLERLKVSHERVDYLKPHELRQLLAAAVRHDAARFTETRAEHAGLIPLGSTWRYEPVAPFVACVLLSGMRRTEALTLEAKQVDLESFDNDGRVVGEIHLTGATKTKRARTLDLAVSPALRELLEATLKSKRKRVFRLTKGTAAAAVKRLIAEYEAPENFGWQMLRRTCGCFLTNAPGIFGAASAYRSAKQLGHSVLVAERHYVDVVRGIPREARTLEHAMQIEAEVQQIIDAAKARASDDESAVSSMSA